MGRRGRRSANMAFNQISARTAGPAHRDRPEKNMSPDPWEIFRALRDARATFGLKPGHIQTLQALLSFIRPGQGTTVFASNVEICRRTGGVDERTLRRHIDRFVELGFIERHDSPNGKRYRVSACDGQTLSFGLSLAPLMDRAEELLKAASDLQDTLQDQIFLRKQLLAKLAIVDTTDPDNTIAQLVRKMLRRKLSVRQYQSLLEDINAALQEMSTAVDAVVAVHLSGNDGQNVRHLSKSEEVSKESEADDKKDLPNLRHLTSVCNEAMAYSTAPLLTWHEVEQHAATLAPMMGIHPKAYADAGRTVGSEKAAAAIFILLQLSDRVRNCAAYFHSITVGRRATEFRPWRLLAKLSQRQMAFA